MVNKEVYILLDSVRSLYNVGSIFRTADAVGVKKIYLAGISGVEKFGETVKLNPRLAKTALEGLNVPWEYCEDAATKLKGLKKDGVQIVSLELTPKSVDYKSANYKFPLCLVVGHETLGVRDEINELAASIIHIPMLGKGKSLNVSIAAAIALYEINSNNN